MEGLRVDFLYGSRNFEKTGFCKKRILEKITIFAKQPDIFLSFGDTFYNAYAVRIKHCTNKLLNKTVLENMGYWQNGNGPSRRHIEGSKIAKGLQSVKYSLLQYPHGEKMKLDEFFLKSPVSRVVPKNVKGGPLRVFEHPFFCKIEEK